MSDLEPVMVGYIVRPLGASWRHDEQAEEHLLAFAERLGHQVSRVFRDDRHGRPCAAIAMLTHAREHRVDVVALVGDALLAAQHRRELGAAGVRLVTTHPPP